MGYEILDHTSEAKFEAKGETMEKAFSEAVNAFSEIAGGEGGQNRHKIEVESESHEALLFDFLDELIFLQDTEDVIISHPKELTIKETKKGHRLEATVWTNPIAAGSQATDIKGPTYSEMSIDYIQGEGWKIVAVLDI